MHALVKALRSQQVLCRFSATAAAPSCQACVANSSALRQGNPQLMRVKQPQGQNGHSQQGETPWLKYLGAGGAAAAAGWAAWSYSSNRSSLDATFSDPRRLATASPRGQAAVAASCTAPLLHLQHGLNPTPAQLQGIAAALDAEADALGPELATGLWGLAMFGAVLPQQQLARLAEAVMQQLAQLPVHEAIISTWALSLLCSSSSSSSSKSKAASSSSSNNSSSGGGSGGRDTSLPALTTAVWQRLLQQLEGINYRDIQGDEASLLYLLHTAMQQAAAAAAASPTATPASSSDSRDSSSGADWKAAAAAAAAAVQPHASLQEVLHQLEPLHPKLKKRLAAVYQEYVPFQPYIEGPFLVVLHVAKTLPRYIAAAAAGSTAAGPSPLAAVFGGLSAADAQSAAYAIADPASLGKLKRDLFFRWRADELLDRHQQAVNQVVHVLHRRLQLPHQQGSDADVILPSLRAAVFVVDDSQAAGCQGVVQAGQQQQLSGSFITSVTASPPSPFTAAFWVEAHVGLQQLMRSRYSAPPGGFVCRSCQGIAAAKVHCLQQRGWTVVVLQQSEVEAALGGFKAGRVKVGQSYDYRGLEQLLRSRLEL